MSKYRQIGVAIWLSPWMSSNKAVKGLFCLIIIHPQGELGETRGQTKVFTIDIQGLEKD